MLSQKEIHAYASAIAGNKSAVSRGKSHRELEQHFGLTGDRPIYNLFKRERRKEKMAAAKIAPRVKVLPVKDVPKRDILAMRQEIKTVAAKLQLHSDQGAQCDLQAFFELTQKYGITPSISRRGNCYDNPMAENFFSILKTGL